MANRVQGRDIVFRVAGLPPGPTKEDAASIINQVCEKLGTVESSCHPTVHSLGQDPYCPEQHIEMVATVTFETVPPRLVNERSVLVEKEAKFRCEWMWMSLTFDITFLGFTPLNEVDCQRDEVIDCIVVSGLASHAYGSWKSRNGHFMWLRDDPTWRKPNVRVMLYGYDTTLVESEYFQTIENIGTELGCALTRIRRLSQKQGQVDPKPCPIVFIAHSLGGLVVKEAICKMSLSKDEYQRTTASSVYGLIFFGVPNTGIRIEHWLRIVKDRPNEALVRDLRPGSEYLLELQTRFETQFTYPKSKVLSIFETMRTRTTKASENTQSWPRNETINTDSMQFEDGRWQLKGPTEILVEEESATKPMNKAPESISLYTMQMNQNHADLPKFLHRHDLNYRNLIMELKGFWENAIGDVRSRFTTGTRVSKRPSSHPRKKIQAKNLTGQVYTKSSKTQSTTHPEFGTNVDKTLSNNASNISAEPTDSSMGLQRLQLVEDSPKRPSPGALSRKSLQSHAPESGDDLSKASSLHEAVVCGRKDVVSCFLCKGADVHKKDALGATLLHTAVANGHIDLVNLLVENGADVKAKSLEGLTPMHLVPAGRSDIVQLLVDLGLDINSRDRNGRSGLVLAVLQGQEERVRTYLLNGADVNAVEPIQTQTTAEGVTELPPILIAIHEKQTGALKLLVQHGADLRSMCSKYWPTALHYAVGTHNHEAVECLIDAKVNLEVRDTEGHTALHILAWKRDGLYSSILLHLLVNAGAKVNAQNRNGYTPLHIAAQEGSSMVAQGLLDAGAAIEARSRHLRTPLHQAAQNGHLEVVKRLLEKGAVIHRKDKSGETALHIACHTRSDTNLSVIKHLLSCGASVSKPANVARRLPPHHAALFGFKEAVELFVNMGFKKGSPDAQGWQMIHHAALNGHVDVLKFLLERGTRTTCGIRTDGGRPLHLAASRGHAKAVSTLCKFRADVNLEAWRNGCRPIHYAAQRGHTKVVSELHKNGADVDALDNENKTAIFYAVHNRHARTVSLLCDLGASVKKGDVSLVLYAALRGYAEIVSVFCQKGVNFQIDKHTRRAPIFDAAMKGHIEVVRILLEHGADVNVKVKSLGWTPLHTAANRGHKDVVNLLLEKGADREAETYGGRTARALAKEMGHLEICRKLGKSTIHPQPDVAGEVPEPSSCERFTASGGKESE